MSHTYEIRDAFGRVVRCGDVLSGDFTIYRDDAECGTFTITGERCLDSEPPSLVLSAPPPNVFTFSAAHVGTGSGDGRGGNARDRRKARRAGWRWRLPHEAVRDAQDAPDAMVRALDAAFWSGAP